MKKDRLLPLLVTISLIIFLAIAFWFKKDRNDRPPKQQEAATNKKTEFDIKYVSSQKNFKNINNDKYRMIDIRTEELFNNEHIESSINYPISKLNQSETIPSIIFPRDKSFIIIDETETEAGGKLVERLTNQNYEAYYLKGGIAAYRKSGYDLVSHGDVDSNKDISKVTFMTIDELLQRADKQEIFKFLDVRQSAEYEKKHLENSVNIPLEELEKRKKEIPIGKIVVVDEDSIRSFKAAVRLYDMNILGVYCFSQKLSELEEKLEEEISDDIMN